MKIQLMAAKISAWEFFWTLFPMALSVFLLSFQFDPFCKTVTEVKPLFVKNEKNDITQ